MRLQTQIWDTNQNNELKKNSMILRDEIKKNEIMD